MLLLCASIVHACDNNPYLCLNPDLSGEAANGVTKDICNNLGEKVCDCGSDSSLKSCDLHSDNVAEFERQCEATDEGWFALKC